jgi:hypothetical protein
MILGREAPGFPLSDGQPRILPHYALPLPDPGWCGMAIAAKGALGSPNGCAHILLKAMTASARAK